jgi:hypothetical protein
MLAGMTRWERLDRRGWLVRGACQATTYFAFCVAGVELLRREGVISGAVYSRGMITVALGLWLALMVWRWVRERQALD